MTEEPDAAGVRRDPASGGEPVPAGDRASVRDAVPGRQSVTYEVARAELEDVVRRLEAGGVSLEESLALWERGEELARTCQALLEGARARLAAANPPS